MSGGPRRPGRVTIADPARQIGVAPKTVRNLLSEHRADFAPPVYGMSRFGRIRLLSPQDVWRLGPDLMRCWVRRCPPRGQGTRA